MWSWNNRTFFRRQVFPRNFFKISPNSRSSIFPLKFLFGFFYNTFPFCCCHTSNAVPSIFLHGVAFVRMIKKQFCAILLNDRGVFFAVPLLNSVLFFLKYSHWMSPGRHLAQLNWRRYYLTALFSWNPKIASLYPLPVPTRWGERGLLIDLAPFAIIFCGCCCSKTHCQDSSFQGKFRQYFILF